MLELLAEARVDSNNLLLEEAYHSWLKTQAKHLTLEVNFVHTLKSIEHHRSTFRTVI